MAKDQRLVGFAKAMRRQQTPYEEKLWVALRAKRFEGAKFRRQVVIGRYIVDFACRLPRMIAIEVDGESHAFQLREDALRDVELNSLGYRVLRFTNEDVGSNMDGVLESIAAGLDSPSLPPLRGSFSPLKRRENEVCS